MNEEYNYMEGFEDLEYVDPVVPDYYSYISIDMRKLSDEQLEFMKNTLQLSEEEGDVDFNDKYEVYLNKSIHEENWFTYESLDSDDKEISFNDIFKYKEQ